MLDEISEFEKLFVTFRLAVELSLKGFDSKCFASFSSLDIDEKGEFFKSSKLHLFENPMYVKAPTHEQVIIWLNEKYRIDVSVHLKHKDLGFFYGGCVQDDNKDFNKSYGSNFKTRAEALNRGIEEALKLI